MIATRQSVPPSLISLFATARGAPLAPSSRSRLLRTLTMATFTAPGPRHALLEAVARGRVPPPVETAHPSSTGTRGTPPQLEGLAVEELHYRSDDSAQGWVPLRLAKLLSGENNGDPSAQLPVVIILHPTGSCADDLAQRQADFARRGYLAATIDARYHGHRVDPELGQAGRYVYQQSLVRAWREGVERPFLLDNVWDLQRLLDLLHTRSDVDPARIGVTGFSLGGMHSWLLAAADQRVAVAAPMNGVQFFQWAVEHNQFHSRVESIPDVFAAAAQDMGKAGVDAEVVTAVWHRLLPGLLDGWDAPASLGWVAPRPLLVSTGYCDPRCPIEGLELAVVEAAKEYAAQGVGDRLRLFAEPGVGHECTPTAMAEVDAWMDSHLLK